MLWHTLKIYQQNIAKKEENNWIKIYFYLIHQANLAQIPILKNIINHLPDNDYYVIYKSDKMLMGKKNLIISPSGLKKHIFNQVYLPILIYKLK